MRKSLFSKISCFIIKIRQSVFLVSVFLFIISPLSVAEDTARIILKDTIELVEDGESIENLGEDYYFGVLVSANGLRNSQDEIMDTKNQEDSKSLNLSVTDKESEETLLIGKKLRVNGVPIGIRIDSALPLISSGADKLHSKDLTQTKKLNGRWLVTAQAGVEFTDHLFASGGLAVAQVSDDSVIDIDMDIDMDEEDNANNFHGNETIQLGWVVGLGAEVPLNKSAVRGNTQNDKLWVLRLEGAYVNLGGDTGTNSPNNNTCKTQSSLNLCSKGETKAVRFAIIRRF